MRINVYAEELTLETEPITKHGTGKDGVEREFYGIRLYLKSPDELHHSADDDDRSAITFWVPWTRKGGHDFDYARRVIAELRDTLDDLALDVAMEQRAQRRAVAALEGGDG